MSAKEKLDHEAKASVTKTTSDALDAIAEARGDGVNRSDVIREAIRDYIAKHSTPKKK